MLQMLQIRTPGEALQKQTEMRELRKGRPRHNKLHQQHQMHRMWGLTPSMAHRMQQTRRRRKQIKSDETSRNRPLLRMTENNSVNTIAILQYNLHKNLSRTHSILSDPSSSRFTLLII